MKALTRIALTIAAVSFGAALSAAAIPVPGRAAPPTPTPVAPPSGAGRTIDLSLPAGQGRCVNAVTVDEARGLAYVVDSPVDYQPGEPGIFVVDLEKGQVKRRIALAPGYFTGDGGMVASPDGRYLYLTRSGMMRGEPVRLDLRTGAEVPSTFPVGRLTFSGDGRTVVVQEDERIKVYRTADFWEGKPPLWERSASPPPSSLFRYVAISGNRLVMYAPDPPLDRNALLFDLATGKELGRVRMARSPEVFLPGPDGGFAVLMKSATREGWIDRYDADLNRLQTVGGAMPTAQLYDAQTDRYLFAGSLPYPEWDSPSYLTGLSGKNLEQRIETMWGMDLYARRVIPYRDRLVGYTLGCQAPRLDIFDRTTLQLRSRIPLGVRLAGIAIDDARSVLYVADTNFRTHVISIPRGKVLAVWDGGAPMTLDAANRRLYLNTGAEVRSIDTGTGAIVARYPQYGHVAPDAARNVVYIAYRGITMYDLSGRILGTLESASPVTRPRSEAYGQRATGATVNPVTGNLAVLMYRGSPYGDPVNYLRIYAPKADVVKYRSGDYEIVTDVAYDNAGHWYVAYGFPGTLNALDKYTPDGARLARAAGHTGQIAVDESGGEVYLAEDSGPEWETRRGPDDRIGQLALPDLHPENVYAGVLNAKDMVFSGRQRTLYVIDEQTPLVHVMPVDELQPAAPLAGSAAVDLGRPTSRLLNGDQP